MQLNPEGQFTPPEDAAVLERIVYEAFGLYDQALDLLLGSSPTLLGTVLVFVAVMWLIFAIPLVMLKVMEQFVVVFGYVLDERQTGDPSREREKAVEQVHERYHEEEINEHEMGNAIGFAYEWEHRREQREENQ